jgi:hypothetical protein
MMLLTRDLHYTVGIIYIPRTSGQQQLTELSDTCLDFFCQLVPPQHLSATMSESAQEYP